MSGFRPQGPPDIEFFDALGEKPILIGGGSRADFERAKAEGDAINESTSDFGPGSSVSPGTRHLMQEMGDVAGVREATDAALGRYDRLVKKAREATRRIIVGGVADDRWTDEQY